MSPHEAAFQKISQGLALLIEGQTEVLRLWSQQQPSAPERPAEELLTPAAACELTGMKLHTLRRFVAKHPECKRSFGRKWQVERGALLRAARRG